MWGNAISASQRLGAIISRDRLPPYDVHVSAREFPHGPRPDFLLVSFGVKDDERKGTVGCSAQRHLSHSPQNQTAK